MKAKSRQQMALEYGVTRKTFCKWCKQCGVLLPVRRLISPKLQAKIYDVLGKPRDEKETKKQRRKP